MTSILQYFAKTIKYCGSFVLLVMNIASFATTNFVATFDVTLRTACAPSIVQFTNQSAMDQGFIFEWNFGKDNTITTSVDKYLEISYNQPGTYTITLQAIKGTDTAVFSKQIQIYKGPEAAFTADTVKGCAPFTAAFTDNSVPGDGAIQSYLWDLRNGTFLTGSSISYTYTKSGLYDIFLKITDENKCTSFIEKTNAIEVNAKPEVGFKASNTFACLPPLNVSFENFNEALPNIAYTWKYGNNTQSTGLSGQTSYTKTGLFNVTLLATDTIFGCSNTLTKTDYIQIGKTKGAIEISSSGGSTKDNSALCPGKIMFSSVNTHSDYLWHLFRNGQLIFNSINPSFTIDLTDSGKYSIVFIFNNLTLCRDSVVRNFSIDFLTADFTVETPSSSCPLPATLSLKSKAANVDQLQWILPDTIINNLRQIDYVTKKNETYAQRYSHEVNTFSIPIKLQVKNKNLCMLEIEKSYNATLPVARFIPDKTQGCKNLEVTFTDSSRSPLPIVSRKYLIDNEAIAGSKYTFKDTGEFSVKLVVEAQNGCTDTSYAVTIKTGETNQPVFSINKDNKEYCYGDTLTITGIPTVIPIDLWNFSSEGIFNTGFSTKREVKVVVKPETAGDKVIKLSVDFNGCISSTEGDFTIIGPVGILESSFSCDSPMNYQFYANIKPADSYIWSIDSAGNLLNDTIAATYTSSGNYKVSVKAIDNEHPTCVWKYTKAVVVRNISASFTNDSIVCFGDSSFLFAQSSTDYIQSCEHNEGFLWSFGDQSPERRTFKKKYSHLYQSRGYFNIQLIAQADNGCTDTVVSRVHVVGPQPVLSANPVSGCAPNLNVSFNDISTDPTITKIIWLFDDAKSDLTQDKSVTHNYNSPEGNTFFPELLAYDKYGCFDVAYKTIKLVSPNIDFQAENTNLCIGNEALFTLNNTEFSNFIWNYGDNSAPTSTATHTYTTAGAYTVTVKAAIDGCSDSLKKINYIRVEDANAEYSVSKDVLNCYPDSVSFQHLFPTNIADGLWTFDNENTSNGYATTTKYIFNKPGTYNTSLSVRTANNCTDSYNKTITVKGPDADITMIPTQICDGGTVEFSVTNKTNVDNLLLIFGNDDGQSSNKDKVKHTYYRKSANRIITPELQLTSGSCVVHLSNDSIVMSDLQASFEVDKSTKPCTDNELVATNTSSANLTGEWLYDHKPVLSAVNFSTIPKLAGEHTIELIVFDAICSDTSMQNITVNLSPSFEISGNSSICKGKDKATLHVDQPGNWTIQWIPAEGIDAPTSFSPTFDPDTSTVYTAKVSDAAGCITRKDIPVTVHNALVVERLPEGDTTIEIGEKIPLIIFTENEDATYAWTPSADLSCTRCNNPLANPLKDMSYTVKVTDICGVVSEVFNIKVIPNFYMEAPKAFTPNADGHNDVFTIETKNIVHFNLKIFNRWGNLIFESTNPKTGWDGTYNGKVQNIDTYTYFVSGETPNGYKVDKKGNFLLMK